MKPKFLVLICTILFITAIAIVGCSTKGLNFEAGIRSFEEGKYAEALTIFQNISATENKYRNRAFFYVGECYKFQFKWDDALASFQKVVDAEPTTYLGAEARNRIAQIREGRKDVERLKILHANNPGTEIAADSLLELGSVYNNKLGDYPNAIKTYNQLAQEFPGSSRAAQGQIEIGYIYLYKLYDYDTAFKEFAKVNLQNYPDLKFRVSEIEDLRRNVNKTLGEIAGLVAFIKDSQKRKIPEGRKVTGYDIYGVKEDQVAQSFVAVAIKWRSLKNYPKALEAYRMQLDRLPLQLSSSAESRYGIAEIHLERHEYMEAIDAFNEFIAKNPTYYRRPEAVYNMAICYEALRQYEKAYEYYKTYSVTYPEGERIKAVGLKVRQYEFDEDQDGFPLYKELDAGTSDTDPNSRPK
ncbi:TPA: tetratricopeptide repeat protein [bacterium]|nr:tetratricopeptide repeat protein [bacterium]